MKEKSTPPKATEEQVNQQQDSKKITLRAFLESHRSIEQIFGPDLREALQDSADELPERTEAEWDKFLRELAIVYPRMRAAKEKEISLLNLTNSTVGHAYILGNNNKNNTINAGNADAETKTIDSFLEEYGALLTKQAKAELSINEYAGTESRHIGVIVKSLFRLVECGKHLIVLLQGILELYQQCVSKRV